MSNVVEYLSSPQAVAAAEEYVRDRDWIRRGPWVVYSPNHVGMQPAGVPPLRYFYDAKRLYSDPYSVYFRTDGAGSYIVTDNGEAVRALRLRTGVVLPDIPLNVSAELTALSLFCHQGVIRAHQPTAADLPRAIVAVLLAAHKIASMDH